MFGRKAYNQTKITGNKCFTGLPQGLFVIPNFILLMNILSKPLTTSIKKLDAVNVANVIIFFFSVSD